MPYGTDEDPYIYNPSDSESDEDFQDTEPNFRIDPNELERLLHSQPAGFRRSLPDVNRRSVPGHKAALRAADNTVNTDETDLYETLRNKRHDDEDKVKYETRSLIREYKYGVTLSQTMTRRKVVFDTESIRSHFENKKLRANRIGRAMLAPSEWRGLAKQRECADQVKEDWVNALIFVCARGDRGPSFYSHVCKVHRFHHSSFTAGGDLIGAGEWVVQKGRLLRISANSGHYQPTLTHLLQTVKLMGDALRPDTQIMLWDTSAEKWVYIPAFQFLNEPNPGGKYKTHPNVRL